MSSATRSVEHRWFVRAVLVLLFAVTQTSLAETEVAPGSIWIVEIDGAIGPATSDYVLRSFEKAEQSSASLIIIRMNTPGGLDTSLRDIIEGILGSNIPVACFVSPKGARAASAGTDISYASHIAAMDAQIGWSINIGPN